MKKWISLLTGSVCILTSSLRADEAAVEVAPEAPPAAAETFAVTPDVAPEEQAPKQVGKASVDGSDTAKTSNAAKYVLAATAVAVGVTALILVARHDGH